MSPVKLTLIFLLCPMLLVTGQEKSSTDWEKRYKQLLRSDPAIREKVESGNATKEQVIEWLKSEGSSKERKKKSTESDWDSKYEELLKEDPSIREKITKGEATKEQVIEYLKLLAEIDGKKEEWDPESKESGTKNSDHEDYRALVENGEKREYLLHVPPDYDNSKSYPLVINYHGFGDNASDYATNIGEFLKFNETAEKNKFLVAYPQAVFREKGARYWEPGDNGKKSIATNDVYFTKQLIADIKRTHNIELNQVYAVGYSNGGMMAYDLACSDPEFIAAIGIMSGVMLGNLDQNVKTRTPVIHFHGVQDEVLPYNGNQNYTSVPELIERWRRHHQIPKSNRQQQSLNEGQVVSNAYLDPKGQTGVVLYTIKREYKKPGGHVWFSDEIEGTHPNQIMWDFLSQYRLSP